MRIMDTLAPYTPSPGEPILNPAQLASAVYAGDRVRLWRVLERLRSDQRVSVGFLGGSITAGRTYKVLDGSAANGLWHQRFSAWLNASFPNASLQFFNGAAPASTPAYIEACLGLHLPSTVDLVVIEYAANTPPEEGKEEYERCAQR